MSSRSLFINENGLENYKQGVSANLGGNVLLNFDEFATWIASRRASERINDEDFILQRQNSNQKRQEKMIPHIKNLASNCCRGSIGQGYVDNSFAKLIGENVEFDLLVIMNPEYKDAVRSFPVSHGNEELVTKKRIKQYVLGFLIAQYGECVQLPNTWSVNLICTKDSGSGTFLMGGFLYCINNNISGYDKIGVLELAGGYTNMPGFISYTKSGFNPDYSLNGDDCFGDHGNLPMSANTTQIGNVNIVSWASGVSRRTLTDREDESGIFNYKTNHNTNAPRELGIYNNILFIHAIGKYDYPKYEEEIMIDIIKRRVGNNTAKIIDECRRLKNELITGIATSSVSANSQLQLQSAQPINGNKIKLSFTGISGMMCIVLVGYIANSIIQSMSRRGGSIKSKKIKSNKSSSPRDKCTIVDKMEQDANTFTFFNENGDSIVVDKQSLFDKLQKSGGKRKTKKYRK